MRLSYLLHNDKDVNNFHDKNFSQESPLEGASAKLVNGAKLFTSVLQVQLYTDFPTK